jgi:hypothetical protein
MNEEANTASEGAQGPIALIKDVNLTQILGAIEAPGMHVQGRGAGNSTRWVFDLEGEAGKTVEIFLLDPRNKLRLKPDLMSYSLTALSASFYDARPVATYDAATGGFIVQSQRSKASTVGEGVVMGRFSCRVAIDVMHSATR